MSVTPTIALLTDFGLEDTYVASMKAVIVSRCPECRILDLTHSVGPQNVMQAAYLIWTVYRYLPHGCITVCVVDPGVGTERKPIAATCGGKVFVGPDNGWLTHVVSDGRSDPPSSGPPPEWLVVELANPAYWLSPLSGTFHGRDIFAPVAAALASGTAIRELGPQVRGLSLLHCASPQVRDGVIEGKVIHVDHFGNLITDVRATELPNRFTVSVGDHTVDGPDPSYQSGLDLVALIGSSGLVEVAAPNASAARLTGVGMGANVTIVTQLIEPER